MQYLPMPSIFFIIERIYNRHTNSNPNISESKIGSQILIKFLKFIRKILNILKKKDESHSLTISEIIDSEKRAYLNV